MGFHSEIQSWLVNAMLILGLLIFLVGLWMLVLPAGFLKAGRSLSKWVATENYFDYLDKPHYQERAIYRHHRLVGGLIFFGALYSLVMLILKVDTGMLVTAMPTVITRFWSEWFYGTLYYLLLAANFLAVLIGAMIFTRPSLLKGVEKTLNKWIVPEQGLKRLDEAHEISVDVLPGNPRLFGLAVTLGGLYIMLSMAIMLL